MSRKNKHRQNPINEELEAPKLPANFVDQVVNLESELERNCTAEKVSRLIELYSAAVEYFGSIRDNRYIHYKERLQRLLARDDFISAVNGNATVKLENASTNAIGNNSLEKSSSVRSKSIDVRARKAPEKEIKKDADQAIKEHLSSSSTTSFKICEMLRHQEGDSLEQRLKARKRMGSPQATLGGRMRSQTVENLMKISSETKFEKYQEEIEKIMEKYVDEKISRIQTIKNKYREEINEVNMMGNNDTISMVLNQLDRDMQREIDEVTKQIDRERKLEIAELKKQFR
ncbi:unnamed protein product [Blepharisma stoltei]|uniref:Uncharacterized protein n=1 Tax=Blepharisma stoltei TaxID=1481888 RepID=A0AAU9JH96_9CILI|nr:unnamed protein product [Blepharisma stoltei]